MTDNKKSFIAQTAFDYDLPYSIVENIYLRSSEKFYENLEAHLKMMREKNSNPK